MIQDKDNQIIKAWLEVVDSNGSKLASIPLQESEFHISRWRGYWLSNQLLIIKQNQQPNPMDSYRIVNPFSGEEEIFQPWGNLPDIQPLADNAWPWDVVTIFDPTLRWVLYPSYGEKLILWDQQEKEEIVVIKEEDGAVISSDTPKWVPEGKEIVIPISKTRYPVPRQDDFYSVDILGNIKKLSFLNENFDNVAIGRYSLSPDGLKIAFWMIAEDPQKVVLAILDMNTRQVTNLCIPASYHTNPALPPAWSPDSQYLIVESYNQEEKPGQIVVVNIARGFAATLLTVDNLDPVGWMAAP